MKENDTEQKLTAEKVAKIAKERPRTRATKEARYVLNGESSKV